LLHQNLVTSSVVRPTYVKIDLDAISYNVSQLRKKAGAAKIMFILKANAYGHGLLRIAHHLQDLQVDYLGVAYLEEGIMLRESGVTLPVLVLGGIVGEQLPQFIHHNLTITASSVDKLRQIDEVAIKLGRTAKTHLKIDTGMERIGIHYYSADHLLEAALKVKSTQIEGIFTHFAQADQPDSNYTDLQQERFKKVLQFYDRNGLRPPMIHSNNSGALLHSHIKKYDMVRAGLLLYGVYPHEDFRSQVDVRPVLSWLTKVVYFKVVKADHPVSYGSHWRPSEDVRMVTLPVGYGDGYMRAMSDKAAVLIRGQKYNQVGAICMDQMMINIGQETSYNGDEVALVGRQGDHNISIEDLARWAGTIPYEILTNINTRVPRVYIQSAS
jgi:alanine racemase